MDIERLLGAPNIAHVATLLSDGAPHSVPVWIGLEEGRVAVITSPRSQKARNVARDPRVAISLTAADDPFTAARLRGHVVERVEGARAWEMVDRIAQRYIGSPYPRDNDRIVLLIDVDTVAHHAEP